MLITRAITRIQEADDFSATLGSGTNGYAITWNNSTSRFNLTSVGGGGSPGGSSDGDIQLKYSSSFASVANFNYTGSVFKLPNATTIRPSSDSTTAIQFQNAAGTGDLLRLDTTNRQVTICQAGSPVATEYALSIQTDTPYTWLEILNWGGTDTGAFFGMKYDDFQQYNYQGGPISFYTHPEPSNELERLRIENTGEIDIRSGTLRMVGTKVLGTRITGWGAPTGTATRTTFATSTVTLSDLAERVKALIDDLSTHGVIGA